MTVPTEPQEMSPRLPDHMLPKSNHSTTKLVCPSSDGDGQLQRYVGPILCLRTARRWNIEKTGSIRCQSRTNTHHVSHQKGMWSLKTCPERVARHKGQDQAEACISFGDACNPSACEYFTWSIVKWLRIPNWSHSMLTALIAKRSDPGSSTTATWSRATRGTSWGCSSVSRSPSSRPRLVLSASICCTYRLCRKIGIVTRSRCSELGTFHRFPHFWRVHHVTCWFRRSFMPLGECRHVEGLVVATHVIEGLSCLWYSSHLTDLSRCVS